MIERALILSNGPNLVIDAPLVEAGGGTAAGTSLDDVQRAHIEAMLRQCDWKIAGKATPPTVSKISGAARSSSG